MAKKLKPHILIIICIFHCGATKPCPLVRELFKTPKYSVTLVISNLLWVLQSSTTRSCWGPNLTVKVCPHTRAHNLPVGPSLGPRNAHPNGEIGPLEKGSEEEACGGLGNGLWHHLVGNSTVRYLSMVGGTGARGLESTEAALGGTCPCPGRPSLCGEGTS